MNTTATNKFKQDSTNLARASYLPLAQASTYGESLGYTLDKELSRPNTMVFVDRSGQPVVAHRGSVTAKDWFVDDALIAVGVYKNTDRLYLARSITAATEKKYVRAKIEAFPVELQGAIKEILLDRPEVGCEQGRIDRSRSAGICVDRRSIAQYFVAELADEQALTVDAVHVPIHGVLLKIGVAEGRIDHGGLRGSQGRRPSAREHPGSRMVGRKVESPSIPSGYRNCTC
ncbi:hypothetical protein T492DRAFT_842055 [Pavlovales sp. CCMP2436]|nr:hypothetical protein T492DRAFT_842055 [Pavlovales sp. CCMP2436]